jgi:hypothetical protein
VTDLYTKAVEQLGSDKAPVRLGGLYALERLGNGNPPLRQTITDVLCAYLRMPYPPEDERAKEEERQVRLTAQRILANHLAEPADESTQWGALDLDLRGAVLLDFRLTYKQRAIFTRTKFELRLIAHDSTFDATAFFWGVELHHVADFEKTRFNGPIQFDEIKVKVPPEALDEHRRHHPTWPNSPISLLDATATTDRDDVKTVLPPGWQLMPDGTFAPT